MKICVHCKSELPLSDFYKSNKNSDGLQARCKVCVKEGVLLWQKRNKEKINLKNAIWKQEHKSWLYPKAKAYTKDRSTRRRTQTPLWVDKDGILKFYLNCPKGYHVDHIFPIKGKTVSGLHTLNNLQYLPATENLQKGNRVLNET